MCANYIAALVLVVAFVSTASATTATVAVICVIKKGSQGPYQITWEKDGEGLSGTGTDPRVSVSPLSAVSVALRIANLRAEDFGNYSCTARNRFGIDSVTAQLVVHAPPKLKSTGFPTEVSLGDDTVATCLVKKGSSGPYKMDWYKDGDAVGNTDRITVVTKASSVLLSIEGVRVADIGNYTCTAANEFGVDTLTMSLVVTAPVVGKFGFSSDVSLGDEVMENCVVKKGSSGPYRIALLKDGDEVRSDDRVTVSSHSKSSATLRIASLRTEDVGNYTCTASNQYGSDSVTAALLVHGPPKLHSSGFSSELSIGEDAAATCAVKKGSAGPFLLSWTKDSREIENTDRITVAIKATSAMLSIDSVRVEDVGNYTCMAKNAFGRDTLTLPLLVSGDLLEDEAVSVASKLLLSEAPPKVGEFSFPSKLAIGDEVIALCVVKRGSGSGPHHVEQRWGTTEALTVAVHVCTISEQRGAQRSQLSTRRHRQLHLHGYERRRQRQCINDAGRQR
ncbi:hypothetical protein MRX96_041939 [Rhipicephalus microplus]